MASPETIRPQEPDQPEMRDSGSLGSQLRKYPGEENKEIPASIKSDLSALFNKLEPNEKEMTAAFVADIPLKKRFEASQILCELIDAMGTDFANAPYRRNLLTGFFAETRRRLGLKQSEGK